MSELRENIKTLEASLTSELSMIREILKDARIVVESTGHNDDTRRHMNGGIISKIDGIFAGQRL